MTNLTSVDALIEAAAESFAGDNPGEMPFEVGDPNLVPVYAEA